MSCHGAGLRAQTPLDPCDIGAWEAPFNHGGSPAVLPACGTSPIPPWPVVFNAIHMSVIPKGVHQGHVLVWGYVDYSGTGQGDQRVLQFSIVDPENGQFWNHMICLAPDLGDLFCAGHAWNANGDLVIVGGTTTHGPHHVNNLWGGARLLYVWEPPAALGALGTGGTWNFDAAKLLDAERWYPSVLMLGPDPNTDENKMAVLGGTHFGVDINSYQVWRPSSTSVVGSWEPSGASSNTFGGPGSPVPSSLGDYPRAHFLTSQAFVTAGYPADCMSMNHFVLPRTWSGPWNMVNKRVYGSSVMFPISPGGGMQDTVIAMGGLTQLTLPPGGTILPDARVWNPGFGGWLQFPSMTYPRWLFNTVLLPDSTILAVGGEQQFRHLLCCEAPAYHPELFKGTAWQTMAANTIIRDYHSTAVLLPSGRVLTGGGESRNYLFWGNCTNQTGRVPTIGVADYQVFLPPYLNCGATQPTILGQNTVPPTNYWTWPYGTQWNITHSALPIGVSVSKVVLTRVASVTHHADINQRCVELPFIVPPTPLSTVRVAVPTKASYLLPRGFYMVFLVTNQGAPSKAAFVQIQ